MDSTRNDHPGLILLTVLSHTPRDRRPSLINYFQLTSLKRSYHPIHYYKVSPRRSYIFYSTTSALFSSIMPVLQYLDLSRSVSRPYFDGQPNRIA